MLTPRIRIEISLICASLFIAFVIWLIAKQGELDSERILAAIKIESLASNLKVEDLSLREIPVIVQFPVKESNRIVSKNFTVPIDLSALVSSDPQDWTSPEDFQELTYKIEPSMVRTDAGLPHTIQVVAVTDPQEVTLKVRLLTQYAKIDVVTTGSLPGYLELVGPPRPEPDGVALTGSPEALEKIYGKAIKTSPVDLSIVSGSMQVFPQLELPEGLELVGRESDRITVDIGVNERAVEQTLEGVPVSLLTFTENLTLVFEPETVDVTLQGPRSALEAITAEDLAFSPTLPLQETPGTRQQVGLEVRLKDNVPAKIALKTKVMEIRPPRITVEFVPILQENTGMERP